MLIDTSGGSNPKGREHQSTILDIFSWKLNENEEKFDREGEHPCQLTLDPPMDTENQNQISLTNRDISPALPIYPYSKLWLYIPKEVFNLTLFW